MTRARINGQCQTQSPAHALPSWLLSSRHIWLLIPGGYFLYCCWHGVMVIRPDKESESK